MMTRPVGVHPSPRARGHATPAAERRPPTPYGSWTYIEYEPEPEHRAAAEAQHLREVLSFTAPKPSPWVGRLAASLNRLYYLRLGALRHGSVQPVLVPEERARLQALPADAGNLLVGPHPGALDAHLMFDLFAQTRHIPACFLMAAESYYGGTVLRRWLLNRLGVLPVARGRRNPEAIGWMTARLAQGWWAGIFPEGDVYFSREVMPMEYGALRIAVEAALAAQRDAPAHPRPILITPFAYAYVFADPARTRSRLRRALQALEARPEVLGKIGRGDVPARLRAVANKLLEYKAEEYDVPPARWQDADPFERGRKLQSAVLDDLETRYLGQPQQGFARRRALKVRMRLFARLAQADLPEAERAALHRDVRKTREIVLTLPFSRDYAAKYGDLEMAVEYLRRFQIALGIESYDFGPQRVLFKVLAPIDVHALARRYRAIGDAAARRSFLFRQTDSLRETIQAGVDAVRRSHAGQPV